MAQSDAYKYVEQTDYLADLVGADIAQDVLRTVVQRVEAAVDIADRADRDLGNVEVANLAVNSALASDGSDTLQVEQQTPVVLEDTGGTAVDPATETTLDTLAALVDALASNDSDTLLVEQQGVVDVSSRDGRNLGDVDVTALPDVTVATLPDSDYVEAAAAALTADGSNEYAPTAQGADTLDGRVKSSGTYDAVLEWQDSAGNVVKSVDLGTGVAADTWTDVSGETAITPYPVVRITDTSSAAQTVDAALHLR